MSIIDEFLIRYNKMSADYKVVKEYAQGVVETTLKDAGIMAITTSRMKENERLREKLTHRNLEKSYQSAADIEADVPDFIGMRIALYFPNDKDIVHTLISRLFEIEKIKQFPDEQRHNNIYTRRFPGYCATHFRVYLKRPPKTELGNPRIEIQVASLLMHAWSEVEHDLTYKQKKGTVSYDEYESLDEMNGLVLAGELSLQRLQRISELRISSEKKEFENHYQLASFIYDKAASFQKGSSYLGDIETLFKIFKSKNRLTPKKIENDLGKIDWNGEIPIAQQLIDLYADSSVNASQLVIAYKTSKVFEMLPNDYRPFDDSQIGAFLRKWVGIEKKLTELLLNQGYSINRPGGIHRLIVDTKVLPEYIFEKYNVLRKVRNKMVHSVEMPEELYFETYMGMIDEISSFLFGDEISIQNRGEE